MALYHDFSLDREDKRKATERAEESGAKYIMFYEEVVEDVFQITVYGSSISFKDKNDMFAELQKLTQRGHSWTSFEKPDVQTIDGKSDIPLSDDAKLYLSVWKQEMQAQNQQRNRGMAQRFSEILGLSAKPVRPTESLTGHFENANEVFYTDNKTGRRFNTRDPILAVAMARNLIVAPN